MRWVSESEHAHALMAPRLPAPTEGPDACKVWEIRVKTLGREDDIKKRVGR